LDDATANLRQFMDRQSFDPERMEELNTQLEFSTVWLANTAPSPKNLNKNMNTGNLN
jgi:DNA repair protein RecN (Recombination protein N)